jgi:hypothetical protein
VSSASHNTLFWSTCTARSILLNVLRAVSVSRVKIEDLVLMDVYKIGEDFAVKSVPGWPRTLDMTNLRRLALSVDVGFTGDISATLASFLKTMPVLEELWIDIEANDEDDPAHCSTLLDLNFPRLRKSIFSGVFMDAQVFLTFLRRHCLLEEIRLDLLHVYDDQLYTIFTMIRDQIKVVQMHVDMEDFVSWVQLSTKTASPIIASSNISEGVKVDLIKYDHRQGQWTQRLIDQWGPV